MDRGALARGIFDKAHLRGRFVLRSGAVSDTYFDKYRFESDPALLEAIAAQLAPMVPPGVEMLAGLELGGVPIATALSRLTGLPALFVRKKAKEYGTCKLAEGGEIEGRRLLLVEDVVSSGGQILLSTSELRTLGATVDTALCVIDRESGGLEALADHDVELRPLFAMSELMAAGESS